FASPEPRRGGVIIAQGKAAACRAVATCRAVALRRREAAVLGKTPPHSPSFFPSGLPRKHSGQTGRKKRGNQIGSPTQGGARSSLALGYYHLVPTGLQLGSLCSHNWRTVSMGQSGLAKDKVSKGTPVHTGTMLP